MDILTTNGPKRAMPKIEGMLTTAAVKSRANGSERPPVVVLTTGNPKVPVQLKPCEMVDAGPLEDRRRTRPEGW